MRCCKNNIGRFLTPLKIRKSLFDYLPIKMFLVDCLWSSDECPVISLPFPRHENTQAGAATHANILSVLGTKKKKTDFSEVVFSFIRVYNQWRQTVGGRADPGTFIMVLGFFFLHFVIFAEKRDREDRIDTILTEYKYIII